MLIPPTRSGCAFHAVAASEDLGVGQITPFPLSRRPAVVVVVGIHVGRVAARCLEIADLLPGRVERVVRASKRHRGARHRMSASWSASIRLELVQDRDQTRYFGQTDCWSFEKSPRRKCVETRVAADLRVTLMKPAGRA
jgi:hypothetical protein